MAMGSNSEKNQKRPTLLDYYSGRVMEEQAVKMKIQALKSGKLNHGLIELSGMGGEGKSAFIEKLQSDLAKEKGLSLMVKLDANRQNNAPKDILSMLTNLRNLMVHHYNFDFWTFDLAIAILDRQRGTNTKLATFQSVNEDNVSISGLFTKIKAERSEQLVQKKQFEMEELLNTPVYEAKIHYLLDAFKADFNRSIAAVSIPMTIVIDTFEEFQLDRDWLFSGEETAKYGYGLCHSLDKTLWLIASRDSLNLRGQDRWDDTNFWRYQLVGLSESETNTLLEKRQLTDKQLKLAIYHATNGYPLLLDLYSEWAVEMLAENKSVAEIIALIETDSELQARQQKTLVERFMRYLNFDSDREEDQSFAQMIRLLACLGSWRANDYLAWEQSDELVNVLPKIRDHGDLAQLMEAINHKSLVRQSDNNLAKDHLYSLDRTVQATLLHGEAAGVPLISRPLKAAVRDYLVATANTRPLAYYEATQIVNLSIDIASDLPPVQRYQTVREKIRDLVAMDDQTHEVQAKYGLIFYLIEQIPANFYASNEGQQVLAGVVEELIEDGYFDGRYQLEAVLPTEIQQTALLASLAKYYLASGADERAKELADKILLQANTPTETVEGHLRLLDYGVTMHQTAVINEQIDQLDPLIELATTTKEQQREFYKQMTLLHAQMSASEQGSKFFKRYLDVAKPETEMTRKELVDEYRFRGLITAQFGMYQDTMAYFSQALKWSIEVYGQEHLKTIELYKLMAGLISLNGSDESGLKLGQQALEISRKVYGNAHPETLNLLQDLAYNENKLYHFAAQQAYLEEMLETIDGIYPDTHPIAQTVLMYFGEYYQKTGDEIHARHFFERVLTARKAVLPENAPEVIEVKGKLLALHLLEPHYTDAELATFRDEIKGELDQIKVARPFPCEQVEDLAFILAEFDQRLVDDDHKQAYAILNENARQWLLLSETSQDQIAMLVHEAGYKEAIRQIVEDLNIQQIKNEGLFTRDSFSFFDRPNVDSKPYYVASFVKKNVTALFAEWYTQQPQKRANRLVDLAAEYNTRYGGRAMLDQAKVTDLFLYEYFEGISYGAAQTYWAYNQAENKTAEELQDLALKQAEELRQKNVQAFQQEKSAQITVAKQINDLFEALRK